jgi:DNA replication protein DnaC
MNSQTLERLQKMNLYGMYDAFKTSLETTLKESLTRDQFIARLVASEWDNRRNRAVERAVKAACFRYSARLEEVDYAFERGLDRNQVKRLACMDFIRERRDLFITGPRRNG